MDALRSGAARAAARAAARGAPAPAPAPRAPLPPPRAPSARPPPATTPRRRLAVRRMRAAAAPDGAAAPAPALAASPPPPPAVLATLRAADAWCFDVDSTFCTDESIDELAAFLSCGAEVAALTAAAMAGGVPFQDALTARLERMRPSRADVARFLAAHPPALSPGIPELLAALARRGKRVYLVSGGFRQIIHPLAESLNIPLERVYANQLLFNDAEDADGAYAGFDPDEFTSRSGGKREAVAAARAAAGGLPGGVVMVGDGATDAEARAPGGADAFVGYGGVVRREAVAARADWYVMDIAAITAALED
jgi:phosphoserine phosphatase